MTEDNYHSLLGALWRYRWTSVVIVLAVTALSYGAALMTSSGPQATATIGLRTPRANNVLSPGVQGDASLARYTAQRARFIMSDEVMGAIGSAVGTTDLTAVRHHVRAIASPTSNIVTVVAEADTSAEAQELAHAAVDAYRRKTDSQVGEITSASIDALDDQIQQVVAPFDDSVRALPSSVSATVVELQLQIAELEANRAEFGDGVEFVTMPTDESVVVPGLPVRELALGVLVGLAVAAMVARIRVGRNGRGRYARPQS